MRAAALEQLVERGRTEQSARGAAGAVPAAAADRPPATSAARPRSPDRRAGAGSAASPRPRPADAEQRRSGERSGPAADQLALDRRQLLVPEAQQPQVVGRPGVSARSHGRLSHTHIAPAQRLRLTDRARRAAPIAGLIQHRGSFGLAGRSMRERRGCGHQIAARRLSGPESARLMNARTSRGGRVQGGARRQDLNLRPSAPEADALSPELRALESVGTDAVSLPGVVEGCTGIPTCAFRTRARLVVVCAASRVTSAPSGRGGGPERMPDSTLWTFPSSSPAPPVRCRRLGEACPRCWCAAAATGS